ncbi:hypothetical protein CLOM_g17192, partial [Closterium sp. NIES-68]
LAECEPWRAAIRGLMPHLPPDEILSPKASWITTTVRTAHKALDARIHGLRNRVASAGASQNNVVLVVVDRFTKMAHFVPYRTAITAEQTAKLFILTVFRLQGIPKAIVSDRDPIFTSKFWTKMWEQYGTRLHLSTAYHPQTDGQTERTNQTMEQLIRTTYTGPTDWEDSLPLIEFAYNNAPSSTTAQSPFYLNYGLNLTTPMTPLVEI